MAARVRPCTMHRRFLSGKIHRATVTGANLDYEGSITIDTALLEAAGMTAFEQVHVYNISNGNRVVTYALEGASGEVTINGAAARLFSAGDLIIITTFVNLDDREVARHQPQVVLVDTANRIVAVHRDQVAPSMARTAAAAPR